MSIPLNEIRFVDMKRSGYNEKKSSPLDGEFVFDNPIHYLHLENGATDKVTIAKEFGFVLKWGSTVPRDLSRLKWKGYQFITMDDGIYPEPLELGPDGHFLAFDAPLMKVNTEHYIKTRKEEIAKSESELKSKRNEMSSLAHSIEPGAVMTDDEIEEFL